jgi:hypothetical protein
MEPAPYSTGSAAGDAVTERAPHSSKKSALSPILRQIAIGAGRRPGARRDLARSRIG